ncbi:MAG: cytosolic protein [Ignavibacteria bacterium]|nr:cytosolic protein [Ignavibacteria bacterium]
MKKLKLKEVQQYVEENIGTFHQKRISSLDGLRLSRVLSRKNPYLFKAKFVLTSEKIIKGIVDAHISSNEETIFGDWLEGLAIFINKKVFNGKKSSASGIDLEFEAKNIFYLVNIKSGPNWGNNSQQEKMAIDFSNAKKRIHTSGNKSNVICVNGCCYGKDNSPHKFPKKGADYFKYCGKDFWKFISGNDNLYLDIIEPLGYKAKEKNDEFNESYSRMINKFTKEFSNLFCLSNGEIDWVKIVKFNSSSV